MAKEVRVRLIGKGVKRCGAEKCSCRASHVITCGSTTVYACRDHVGNAKRSMRKLYP